MASASRTQSAASTSLPAGRPPAFRSVRRTSSCRCAERRQAARHQASSAHLVDDVDGVVLAVGPREADEDGEPADEPEAALLRERAVEDELAPAHVEVSPPFLLHAVDVDLQWRGHGIRERDAVVLIHATTVPM